MKVLPGGEGCRPADHPHHGDVVEQKTSHVILEKVRL